MRKIVKHLPSLCCSVMFSLLLYSAPSLGGAILFSAGADPSADLDFAKKALALWQGKWSSLSERIVSHSPDNSFALVKKRPKKFIKSFANSNHPTILAEFLAQKQEQFLRIERDVDEDLMTEPLEKWYEALAALSVSTFVGAEWIVSTPYLATQIAEATQKSTHKLFQPKKFGFNLRRQAVADRERMRQICADNERKLCDELAFTIDLENLPRTWPELSVRRNEMFQAILSRVNDAVSGCQAQIDNFILTSGHDENLAETIALRVERESNHVDTTLSPSLLAACQAEKDTIRLQFVAKLKSQSVSAAKERADAALPLEDLTTTYRRQLDLVETKYKLINDLRKVHEKNLESVEKRENDFSTQNDFDRYKRFFTTTAYNQTKARVFEFSRERLAQTQDDQLNNLLTMPVASPEDLLTFIKSQEDYQTHAELAKTESIAILTTGGMRVAAWDLRIVDFKEQILARIKRTIAELEYNYNSLRYARVSTGANERQMMINVALVHDLTHQKLQLAKRVNALFREFAEVLSTNHVDQFANAFDQYVGKDVSASLQEYLSADSKFATLFLETLRKIDATQSIANSINTSGRKLANLQTGLLSMFSSEEGEISDAFHGYVNQLRKNYDLAFANHHQIFAVGRHILRNEAESVTPLINAMIVALRKIPTDQFDNFSGTIEHVWAIAEFNYYVENVHHLPACDEIRNFLIKFLRSEEMEFKFGAQKLYTELLKGLGKPTRHKAPTMLEQEEPPAEASSSTDSHDNRGFSGIPNLSNTCFVNVCLQALARINMWSQRGFSHPVSTKKKASIEVMEFREVTEALLQMIRKGDENGVSRTLIPFFDLAYKTVPSLIDKPRGLQDDAQEFWTNLLDILGSDESDVRLPIGFQSSLLVKKNVDDIQGEYGKLEPMHALPLPLVGKKASMKNALRDWLRPESFVPEDSSLPKFKQNIFYDAPEVMVVSLNRFNSDNTKLRTPIAVSDISIPFYQYRNKAGLAAVHTVAYRLVGGIYHLGKFTYRGHYYFVDHATGMVYDDKAVYPLTRLDKKVIQEHSYILFFQRVRP